MEARGLEYQSLLDSKSYARNQYELQASFTKRNFKLDCASAQGVMIPGLANMPVSNQA